MKKTLLLSTALLVSAGAFAQSGAKVKKMGPVFYKKITAAPIEKSEGTSTNKLVGNNSVEGGPIYDAAFTSSRNGYGVLVEATNPLQYDADLNMLSFHHRLATAAQWPTTGLPNGGGESGYQNVHYSTDGGATWAGVCLYANDTYLGRYPSGVIANTPGNTDPANAYFVSTGPCTDGSNWVATFFASCPANSTGNLTTNDQQPLVINGANAAHNTYFPSYSDVNNGTDVWSGAYKYDGSNFYGAAVMKGTLSGGAYVWTQDSVTFGPWASDAGMANYWMSSPQIAWGPDHMTGYVLINGVLAGATGNAAKSYQPNVWKTTDAGATWNLINQGYDWEVCQPQILTNIANASLESVPHPGFFDHYGSGVSVDANGVLHYVTAITAGYSSNPDSLGYGFNQGGFGHTQYEPLDRPWVYDFTTSGNGTWTATKIGEIFCRNIETTDAVPDPAIWTLDGSTPNDYVDRIRSSRSPDGTKIFYSWTDGDTTNVIDDGTGTMVYHANSNPFYEYLGLDVSTGMYTDQMELSAYNAAESGYYFSYTSPISMPYNGGYILPMVYIVSQDGNTNATNAIDYDFVDQMEFTAAGYTKTIAGNTCQSVGIKSVSEAGSYVSQNFPNPFDATSRVKVNLVKATDITLTVTNSLGQVMSSTTVKGAQGLNEVTIDGTSLTSGIYFYSITAGDSKVTRKMNIVK